MLRTAANRRRPGFTLVELMVSAAVCVLIMAVLATAFSLGIDTMRQMRSTGEMMDQLRGAETALKADLKAPHLLTKDGQPLALSSFQWDKVAVSPLPGGPPPFKVTGWSAPENGFVRIGSGPITYPAVATDADWLANGTGIATNHYLHFTSILSGLSDDDYYVAQVDNPLPIGPKTYRSRAAELAYFLDPNPTGVTPGGTSLFRLVRRQRLVALHDTDRRDRPWPTIADHAVVSYRPSGVPNPPFYLATLAELTDPTNRLGGNVTTTAAYAPSAAGGDRGLSPMDGSFSSMPRAGEDTLLSNVISFEVQVLYAFPRDGRLPLPPVPLFPRAFDVSGAAFTTSENPFDILPPAPIATATLSANPPPPRNLTPPPPSPAQPTGNNLTAPPPGLAGTATYDSWTQGTIAGVRASDWTQPPATANTPPGVNQANGVVFPHPTVPPLLIRVQAVQIRIRIWDPKLQNARQVTIVQDL